jgi:hypothetical protein
MPLIPSNLADALEQRWFTRDGGPMPSSITESADAFARCIAPWFAQALAGGFPCSSALARQAQLASLASAALAVGSSAGAAAQLAAAVGLYVAGQTFGPGVAQPPTTIGLLANEIAAFYADLEASSSARAQRLAGACTQLALSTLVVIPSPPAVVPIT